MTTTKEMEQITEAISALLQSMLMENNDCGSLYYELRSLTYMIMAAGIKLDDSLFEL